MEFIAKDVCKYEVKGRKLRLWHRPGAYVIMLDDQEHERWEYDFNGPSSERRAAFALADGTIQTMKQLIEEDAL